MLTFIENISASRASLASIGSAIIGQISTSLTIDHIEHVNTCFQHVAWTVAILAGIVSIANGIRSWFKHKYPRYRSRR